MRVGLRQAQTVRAVLTTEFKSCNTTRFTLGQNWTVTHRLPELHAFLSTSRSQLVEFISERIM
jgi:hypothetical protein